LEEYRNQNTSSKFNQEQKKQVDEIKDLIKNVNEYHNSLIGTLQGKLHAKPDYEVLENFQKNVNEKVLNLLVSKIDRDEHRRIQHSMRKKLNHLEKEVEGR
jgi:S-adenosylmethionine:diacylglycerol 3-amino-3-carboxypropyl transferase